MKFLPPEEEIRAQLRELTSQTRRLRADLQGMITRRKPADTSFSHDKRYRLRLETRRPAHADTPAIPDPEEQPPAPPKIDPRSNSKKRR
jgi:hypothetical protein